MSDEEILNGIKTKNIKVIDFLYNTSFSSVTKYLQNKGCNIDQSQDIYQDSIMALIKNIELGNFKGESKIVSYLTSIAKFKFFNSLKKNDRLRIVEEMPENISFDYEDQSAILNEDVDILIQEKLKNLTGECQKLLLENVYNDVPLKQVAEILNLSYDFVRQKKRRCLNQLKKQLLNNPKIKELYGKG